MKESDIRRYAQLMGELGLTGLEIKNKDDVVRLERSYSAAPISTPVPVMDSAPKAADPDTVSVTSPMVGVFYAAASPGAEPFVRVGSKVKKGDTLCVIEAMKAMNEVTAEADGEVVDICVSDGELVEYDCVLMKIY